MAVSTSHGDSETFIVPSDGSTITQDPVSSLVSCQQAKDAQVDGGTGGAMWPWAGSGEPHFCPYTHTSQDPQDHTHHQQVQLCIQEKREMPTSLSHSLILTSPLHFLRTHHHHLTNTLIHYLINIFGALPMREYTIDLVPILITYTVSQGDMVHTRRKELKRHIYK